MSTNPKSKPDEALLCHWCQHQRKSSLKRLAGGGGLLLVLRYPRKEACWGLWARTSTKGQENDLLKALLGPELSTYLPPVSRWWDGKPEEACLKMFPPSLFRLSLWEGQVESPYVVATRDKWWNSHKKDATTWNTCRYHSRISTRPQTIYLLIACPQNGGLMTNTDAERLDVVPEPIKGDVVEEREGEEEGRGKQKWMVNKLYSLMSVTQHWDNEGSDIE
jgi:hypothetical protein